MSQFSEILDNPVWHSLNGPHETFALAHGDACCYQPDVTPFAAIASHNAGAFEDLALLVKAGGIVALLDIPPALPDYWRMIAQFTLVQMVCEKVSDAPINQVALLTPLTLADVPAMLKLTELTRPGPFLPRTIELGPYLSIQVGGQLAAMAGVRLRPSGYREISAVCTHPSFRRLGYSKLLIRALVRDIQSAGETPFLHVASENSGAISLYQSLGFVPRIERRISVLERL